MICKLTDYEFSFYRHHQVTYLPVIESIK